MEQYKEQYIKVYEWLLKHPDNLTRLEVLLISEIMRWPNGCFKSSAQLAKLLKSDTRTIQRKIKLLFKKKWLTVLYPQKQHRVLFATPKDPPIGPLFEYQKKSMQSIIKRTAAKMAVK